MTNDQWPLVIEQSSQYVLIQVLIVGLRPWSQTMSAGSFGFTPYFLCPRFQLIQKFLSYLCSTFSPSLSGLAKQPRLVSRLEHYHDIFHTLHLLLDALWGRSFTFTFTFYFTISVYFTITINFTLSKHFNFPLHFLFHISGCSVRWPLASFPQLSSCILFARKFMLFFYRLSSEWSGTTWSPYFSHLFINLCL